MGKPVAALIRENEILRNIASAAIRLRQIGKMADEHSDDLEKLWDDQPDMPRSLTSSLMYEQAYASAMKRFDDAVLEAADVGFDWLSQNEQVGPSSAKDRP